MRRFIPILTLALMLCGACSRSIEPSATIGQTSASGLESSTTFVPGSVIVQLDEALADRLVDASPATKAMSLIPELEMMGATNMERLYPDAGEWEPRHRRAGLHRWWKLTIDPDAAPATKAASELASVPGIVYAEPERKIRSNSSLFNDPYASKQWGFHNDGALGASYKPGSDINVVPVWDNFTTGSSDVIVAVLDGAVQTDHPDLAANCIPFGQGSKNFIAGIDESSLQPTDHGSHVAGVIAAINDNGIGINGIAGGINGKNGVRILSCAVFMGNPDNPSKEFVGNTYDAMVWAADHGAVISQNSWGYIFENEAAAKASGVGSMGAAIDYFIENAGCDMDGNQLPDSPMKGGVVFFSAGNNAWSIGWPAAYDKVIAVGAANMQGNRSSYSNYGDWVDICAPGGDGNQFTQIYSAYSNSDYGYMQGTSMACPHVSGVAALLVSYFGGPGFTNEMLKDRLLRGASNAHINKYQLIGPMVDALGSFTLDGKKPPLSTTVTEVSSYSNSVSMSWEVTSDPDDKKAYGYLALACPDSATLAKAKFSALDSSITSVAVEGSILPVGETLSATMTELEFDTDYYVAVVAYDYQRNYSALSAVRKVRTGKNNAPVITTDYTGSFRLMPYEKLTVEYSVSDPDGHPFTVAVDPGSDALSYKISQDAVQINISGNGAPHGKYTAHIVAKDSYQDSTDYAIDYEILENHTPVVISQIPNMSFGTTGTSQSFDLLKYFKDEDGEALTYTISISDRNVAHVNATGNNMVITALGYGLTSVTITATDACKTSCSLSFKILIRDDSRPIDIYPNPVVDYLNIRPGKDDNLKVTITNKAGATVWSETAAAGPFEPLSVDMSGQPGGTYYVRISGSDIDNTFTIAKK